MCDYIIFMQLICLVFRKPLIMTSKLGGYLKTKEATGTTALRVVFLEMFVDNKF